MGWRRAAAAALAAVLLAAAAPALASERNNRYADGEPVTLWVNKVGPFNNPQETYNYYALPYCRARPNERPARAWGGLGEVLQGNELIDSQLDIKFKGAPHPPRGRSARQWVWWPAWAAHGGRRAAAPAHCVPPPPRTACCKALPRSSAPGSFRSCHAASAAVRGIVSAAAACTRPARPASSAPFPPSRRAPHRHLHQAARQG